MNGRSRIIACVCSPIENSQLEKINSLSKMFKKENIDIILVSFGDSQQNNQIFETFISESSSRNESYYF